MCFVSASLEAFSAFQQASAQKNAADYEAQVQANNAKIAAWQRSDALQRGEVEAQQRMRQTADMLGKQRAALAASGVDLNQGSAQDLLASTAFIGQEDVNTITNNAAREAWGYDVQAQNYRNNASFERWKSKMASPGRAAAMAGVSSLISSATSYAMGMAK